MKKIFTILFVIFGTILFGSFIHSLVINDYDLNKASVLGYKLNHIGSASMKPIINKNDYVLTKTTKFKDLKIGDIITYKCSGTVENYEEYENEIIIHRIIEKTDKYVRTKGDDNSIIDPWIVYPEDIISKAIYNINTKTKY